MLEGCVFWPAEQAARYRARGWWQGITIAQMLARSAERTPGCSRTGVRPATAELT